MTKTAIITWIGLLILTIISAFFSGLENKFTVFLIMILAAIKFLGVAFQFMELKKAHPFWKSSIVIFAVIFTALILLIY